MSKVDKNILEFILTGYANDTVDRYSDLCSYCLRLYQKLEGVKKGLSDHLKEGRLVLQKWTSIDVPPGVDKAFNVRGEQLDMDRVFQLDATLQAQFERLFAADLSGVRLHTGAYANAITHNAGADALALGKHIYFADGKYAPDTEEGLKLLTHELQHFIQQQDQKRLVYLEDREALEHEAEAAEAHRRMETSQHIGKIVLLV
jgi:hypothetical protein